MERCSEKQWASTLRCGVARRKPGLRPHLTAPHHAWAVLLLAISILAPRSGWAQEIGTVAELEGTAEIGRAGTWLPAAIGSAIQQGDTLRTGTPGRLRVVLQDDSVLTIADDSEIVIDEEVFDSSQGIARSVMHLLRGKIRALVSEYYERPRNEFRIETKSAIVGVRGTQFVIVFDPATEVTEVAGASGRAEVHSVLDRVGHAVFITAREATTVVRGQYPSPPHRLSDEDFRQYLEKLAFIGHGKPESLVAAQPLLTGSVVPSADRLANLPAPPIPNVAARPAPAGVAPTAPGETAHDVFATQNVGGVVRQPPPVIEATQGKLGIRF